MKTVYADNNATTRVAKEVINAMTPYFTEKYFNPSSMYEQALDVAHAIKKARQDIAEWCGGVNPSEIFFTSCATESNNWAIHGAAKANLNRRHIVTSAVEHPAVLEVCKDLVRSGYELSVIPVDTHGNLDIKAFIRALRTDTLLVSIMHANNETGVIFPIEELSTIVKETDPTIIFHTDATQTAGKIPLELKGQLKNVDMLSFSGHKLHAPKGVGALFIRRGTRCGPFLIGGHQESGRRGGTENVPYIIGLAAACQLARSHQEEELYVRGLRDRLQETIEKTISHIEINGKGAARLPNTLNLACHYIEGESILYQLNAHGICASSGSACTSGSLEPSHVLRAMKVPFTAVHGSVRFSLSRYNTVEEIDFIAARFREVVENLRRASPYWDHAHNAPAKDPLKHENH